MFDCWCLLSKILGCDCEGTCFHAVRGFDRLGEQLQIAAPSSQATHSPSVVTAVAFEAARVMQIVVGDLPIKDVVYCESVRIVLVVLGSEVTRQQLKSLQPDLQSMLSTLSKTHLNGISVTCQGATAPFVWIWCHHGGTHHEAIEDSIQ